MREIACDGNNVQQDRSSKQSMEEGQIWVKNVDQLFFESRDTPCKTFLSYLTHSNFVHNTFCVTYNVEQPEQRL